MVFITQRLSKILISRFTFIFKLQWTQVPPADEDTRLSSISSIQDGVDTAHTTPQQSGKMLSKPIVFSPGATRDNKRKKLELREVFNADEDDNAAPQQRKRKLVPLGKYFVFLLL